MSLIVCANGRINSGCVYETANGVERFPDQCSERPHSPIPWGWSSGSQAVIQRVVSCSVWRCILLLYWKPLFSQYSVVLLHCGDAHGGCYWILVLRRMSQNSWDASSFRSVLLTNRTVRLRRSPSHTSFPISFMCSTLPCTRTIRNMELARCFWASVSKLREITNYVREYGWGTIVRVGLSSRIDNKLLGDSLLRIEWI